MGGRKWQLWRFTRLLVLAGLSPRFSTRYECSILMEILNFQITESQRKSSVSILSFATCTYVYCVAIWIWELNFLVCGSVKAAAFLFQWDLCFKTAGIFFLRWIVQEKWYYHVVHFTWFVLCDKCRHVVPGKIIIIMLCFVYSLMLNLWFWLQLEHLKGAHIIRSIGSCGGVQFHST